MTSPDPIVRAIPPPSGWTSLARTNCRTALETRAALGLPTDRPIVMTGHQAEWWHPGIVAKFIGAAHLAALNMGAWAWVVTDQDVTDPWAFDVPIMHDGHVSRETNRLAPPPESGRVSASLGALIEPRTEHPIALAMRKHADAPDGIDQWSHAMRDLLADVVDAAEPLRAAALMALPPVREAVSRMADEPVACAEAYNRAIKAAPDSRLASLHVGVDPGAVELPLWWIKDDHTRGRVFAGDLPAIPHDRLAPRALMLTLIARWLLCDLFIHGEGGFAYDRATEAWCASWLDVTLSLKAMVSADMRLDLDAQRVSEASLHDAQHAFHSAMHNPVRLGLRDLQNEKDALLASIKRSPRGSRARAERYYSMHALLGDYQREHRASLQRLEREAEALRKAHESYPIATSRTWPFALHDERAQQALLDAVRSSLS